MFGNEQLMQNQNFNASAAQNPRRPASSATKSELREQEPSAKMSTHSGTKLAVATATAAAAERAEHAREPERHTVRERV